MTSIGPNDGIARELLLTRERIGGKVGVLGTQISNDYKGKEPVFVGVLKGSFIFMADLARELDPDLNPTFDFLTVSSYTGTESSGKPQIEKDIKTIIEGKEVIIVEDIVDNGFSAVATLEHLKSKNPASLKLCALLSKPSRRKVEVNIDYLGFEIENKWVEGYGLDTDQKLRHLPDIWYRK